MQSDPSSSLHHHRFISTGKRTRIVAACAAAAFLVLTPTAPAAPRAVAATFTATTTSMTPADVKLRIQILEWSEAGARADVVAALADAAEAAKALAPLPTVGYVWPAGSPVGYSVKYAHRTPAPNGGERITLVMDKRIGSYDYKGWSVSGASAKSIAYSVLELSLDSLWQRRGDAIARGRRRCRRRSGHGVPRYGRDDGQRPKGRQARIGGPVTAGPRNYRP